jgi:hypothetical protein
MDVARIHIAVAEDNPADVSWLKTVLDELALDYKLTVDVDGEDTGLHSRNGCLNRNSIQTAARCRVKKGPISDPRSQPLRYQGSSFAWDRSQRTASSRLLAGGI